MIGEIPHYPQPDDEPRITMSPEEAAGVSAGLASTEALGDPWQLKTFVQGLALPERLDAFTMCKQFVDALGPYYSLYWRDLALLRPCLGIEHNTAVADGLELDYAPALYDEPIVLQVARFLPHVQDGGKALCVAETGNNFGQKSYNLAVTRKVLESVPEEALPNYAKQAVMLLNEFDVIGGLLQGHDVADDLEQFRAAWPGKLAPYRDDLMLIAYLSDASAHSGYRMYHNIRYASLEPAVRPNDAQLSFLFDRHPGGAVTLTPDRCHTLLEHLPTLNRMRYLLTGERGPFAQDADIFATVLQQLTRMHNGVEWFSDPISEDITDRVCLRPDGSILVNRTSRHNTAYVRSARYFTPGDGRVWCHVSHASSVLPMHGFDMRPVPQPAYQHPDNEVAARQRTHLYGLQYRSEDFGHPLDPEAFWQLIHRIESYTYD